MPDATNIFVLEHEANAVRIGVMNSVGGYNFSAERLFDYFRMYQGQEIHLELYSYGGRLVEAFAIADYIEGNNLNIQAFIFGFCGSAATVVSSVCRSAYMGRNSFFFIHNSSNPNGPEDEINTKLDARMVALYQEKTGQDEATIREWMEADDGQGTMFSAQQAIDAGFADGFTSDSNYLERAASFIQNTTQKSKPMDFEAIKAMIGKLIPGKKVEKPEDVEATLRELVDNQGAGADQSEQVQALEAKIDALEAERKRSNENMQGLTDAIANLTAQVAELKAGETKPQQEQTEQVDQISANVKALAESINALKSVPQTRTASAGNAGQPPKPKDDEDDTAAKGELNVAEMDVFGSAGKRGRYN